MKLLSTLQGSRCVDGLALLKGHLFVLRGTRLDVYSSPDSTQLAPDFSYKWLRYISVHQLNKNSWNDMVSCKQLLSLFISDQRHRCVYKLANVTDTAVAKLADVPQKPHGLSITPNQTLLLTCRDDHMLIEISSQTGELIRQIELPAEIDCPYHAAQLTTAQFVVCYSTTDSGNHGVSIVDSQGGTMMQKFTQLHYPSHVLVDESSHCVYVADYQQSRVVRLNKIISSLELLHEVSVGNSDWPWRLCLDDHTRRLIVGLDKGNVIILQLPNIHTTTSV